MDPRHISEYEGTDLESAINEAAENCNDGDALFVSDLGEIVRVDAGLIDLFERQNDMDLWTEVLMNIDFSE